MVHRDRDQMSLWRQAADSRNADVHPSLSGAEVRGSLAHRAIVTVRSYLAVAWRTPVARFGPRRGWSRSVRFAVRCLEVPPGVIAAVVAYFVLSAYRPSSQMLVTALIYGAAVAAGSVLAKIAWYPVALRLPAVQAALSEDRRPD
jgi:hypothetical protein